MARRFRRVRYWRLVLAIALIFVGTHAARISSAQLDWLPSWPAKATPNTETSEAVPGEQIHVSAEDASPDHADCPPQTPSLESEAALEQPPAAEPSRAHSPKRTEVLPAVSPGTSTRQFPIAGELPNVGEVANRITARAGSAVDQTAEDGTRLQPVADKSPATVAAEGVAEGDVASEPVDETPEANNLVLTNPSGTGGAVHCLVNGQVCSLRPGDTRDLGSHGPWTVKLDRSEGFGAAEYTITAGVFAFRVSEEGWKLEPVLSSHLP